MLSKNETINRGNKLTGGRDGFTLIELLVVIAIIAILATILLPSLNKARDYAKTVACMSNMHNYGTAIHMYASSNNDSLPGPCYSRVALEDEETFLDIGLYLIREDLTPSRTDDLKYWSCPSHPSLEELQTMFPGDIGLQLHYVTSASNYIDGQLTMVFGYPNYIWESAPMKLSDMCAIDGSASNAIGLSDADYLISGAAYNINPVHLSGEGRNVLYMDNHVDTEEVIIP